MHCFGSATSGSPQSNLPEDSAPTTNPETPTTPEASPSSTTTTTTTTINLRLEYTRTINTDSYNEIWSKIQHQNPDHNNDLDSPSLSSVDRVLQPDRSSIQETLSSFPRHPLTRLVSEYFSNSEIASHHFLSLRRSVIRARYIYSPIADLIDHLPQSSWAPSQCDWAISTLRDFDAAANPFPAPTSPQETTCNFESLRRCFLELKNQLDSRLSRARRKHRMLRVATRSSAACLVVSAAAAAVAGVVIAAHAVVAVAAVAVGPAACGGGDLLGKRRRRLREEMVRVEKTGRETYVLDNHLDTIERLVARLYETVESDKVLVRLGLERGKGKGLRHSVEEVMRHLKKNNESFEQQLGDLDEHIVLCLAAVNRARSLLIQQIHY